MKITIDINLSPETEAYLHTKGADLERIALEGFAVEAYRQSLLSSSQIAHILGFKKRREGITFLSERDAWPGLTLEDLKKEEAAFGKIYGK